MYMDTGITENQKPMLYSVAVRLLHQNDRSSNDAVVVDND